MKKYAWSVKILTPLLSMAAAVAAMAAVPAFRNWWQPPPPAAEIAEGKTVYSKEEEAALYALIAVYDHMNSADTVLVEGTVQAADPADSSNKVNTAFQYMKQGQEMYYRIGDTEMAALSDVYIAVNHAVKKIFLSAPKKIIPPFYYPQDTLLRMLKEEGYTVQKTTTGPLTTIALLRENHITCKEYRVTYDTASQYVNNVFVRMTDITDPLNKEKDKTIRVQLRYWQEKHLPVALLRKSRYLREQEDNVFPATVWQDYELIRTY